jgi:hypothetical protein
MALTDKNIVITPNVGSATDDPKIVFTGATSSTGPFPISLRVYPTQSGTISLEGSAGQLFSVANTLSGSIFSVNDISGMPSIEVLDTGTIKLAQYGGNVGIGTASPVYKLDVSVPTAGPNVVAVRSITGQSSYLSLAGHGSTPLTGASFDIIQDSAMTYVWNRANTPLTFGTNNTERVRVDGSGNVGVNTSTGLGTNGRVTIYEAATARLYLTDNVLGQTYGGSVRGYGVTAQGGYLDLGAVDANVYNSGIKIYNQATAIGFQTGNGVNGTTTEKFRISSAGLTGTLPIGSLTASATNLVTAGNIGAWLGGFSDATSGWALSYSVMALKPDNTTYSTIGMAPANGLLYFARTNASGVGTLNSWLTVASNMQTTFPYNINGVTMSLSGANASYTTPVTFTNTTAGGGVFNLNLFAGALANAVAGDSLITNGIGNMIISPNAASKTIKLVPGLWNTAVAAEVTDTGLTVRGTQGLTLNSGLNISWGGVYGAGIPTITNSGTGTLVMYASGSTDGITHGFNTNGIYTKAANNYGYGFWGGSALSYGMMMSTSADTTYGGRIPGESTSDYNMYFTMTNGTNRGFVFRNAYATPIFSINGDGYRSVYSSAGTTDVPSGSQIIRKSTGTAAAGLGISRMFTLQDAGANLINTGGIRSYWVDPAVGVRNANTEITAGLGNTEVVAGTFMSNGGLRMGAGGVTDTSYARTVNPGGGYYVTNTSSQTGAIAITLPVGMLDSMMRVKIKIYLYGANTAFEVDAGGYAYATGNTWANNPFAYITAPAGVNLNYTVRLGYTAGGKAVIYIGELGTVWSYPQIFVTECLVGYNGRTVLMNSGWSIGFQATAFETVTATISNAQIGQLATAAPAAIGTAAVGTSTLVARSDHVHNIATLNGTTSGIVTTQGASNTALWLNGNGAWSAPTAAQVGALTTNSALGTPASGVLTNCTGVASGLTAGFSGVSSSSYISDNVVASASYYPVWVSSIGNGGAQAIMTSGTKLSFVPTTGVMTAGGYVAGTFNSANFSGSSSGTNTGDNSANSNYASDYRAANFVAGTNYVAPSATFFIGTSSIAHNRASAAIALTGITSIDGTAATANALNTANAYTGTVFIGSGTPSVGQFHAVAGSASTWYNAMIRNDGSNVYLLSSAVQTTQAAANTASWNTFRPFAWNLSNGTVQLCGDGAQVNAGGSFVATGNVTAYSDERLKKDWAPLATNFVEQLADIKHGSYTRIDNDLRQVGVSAQSLQTLLPEAVLDGEHLSVAYGNAAMVSAVELAKEVVEMKSIIEILRAELAETNRKLNELIGK